VEDILAEYQAEERLQSRYAPEPDGRGEYYSSSQGGAEDYYDSASYEPERSYYNPASSPESDFDAVFDKLFSQYDNAPAPQSFADDSDMRIYGQAPAEAPALHSGSLGAMEREARDTIARLRRDEAQAPPKRETVDLYAPVGEDERPYRPPVDRSAPKEPEREQETDIDSRFNLSGKKKQDGFVFGSRAIDMSADADYSPSRQPEHDLRHWAPERDDDAQEEEDTGRRKGLLKKLRKEKATEGYASDYETQPEEPRESQAAEYASYAGGFRDHQAVPSGSYAEDGAYDDYDEEDPGFDRQSGRDLDLEDDLPSFREYVASLVASAFLRLRGTNRSVTTSTMSDSEEDLGPELTPAGACRYYGSFMRSQRLRLRLAVLLEVLLCYLSLGLPLTGMLQHLPVMAAACCALQFAIMLLCLDVVTGGILNAARGKVGADALAVLSCLLTSLDGMIVALSDSAAPHTPLCAVSSLSLLGVMLASALSTRGIRKAMRVPAIGKHFYAVTGETKLRRDELTLLKSLRSAKGFVRRTEEAAPDETLFNKLGPVLILLALVLSLVMAAVKKTFADFVFIFSAILAPAAPFCALLAFALPYFVGSMRIFRCGAAIAGWSGLCDIGASRNLIVTDRDLFPESSIEMGPVRIFSDESTEKVISYAGTLVAASGSSIGGCFAKLMEENHCSPRQVENFEFLPGGGLKGIIEGHVVLCGGTELMRLMNVRIPYRLTEKTSVLLAIDGILYGIFSLNYTPLPQVRRALVELVRSGRHPVFAVRDFNVNPEMLHNTFDLATDGYDFPPYVERFAMSEPSQQGSKIAAVICNEGLGPLTEVADVGRSMYLAVRVNLVVAVLAAVLGSLIVFAKLLTAGSVTIGFLLLLLLAWAIPMVFTSLFVGAKP
ncbi:MAG: hypothetical protein ACI4O0_00410, partial [Candidatus Limivicinus sp.]